MKAATAALAAAMLSVAIPARGDGMVSLEIRNDTAAPLQCQALVAHWHTLPLQTVAPGDGARFSLLRGAAGAWFTTPAGLPVELVYCGPPGQAWAHRAELDLSALARLSATDAVLRAACRTGGDGVSCVPVGQRR